MSLCIHSFLEGFPIHQNNDMVYGVLIHKIPIAIILGTFFVNSNVSKLNAVIFLLIFSLMSPLGSFAGENVLFLTTYKTEITAVIIGIFLHISTIILFETSKDHNFNLLKFVAILVGMVVAFLA